jgi:hypothetical protein
MNISLFELITVSERVQPIIPGLTQVGLDITSGSTYRLTFDATITTGILKVYQGTQLIFSSAIIEIMDIDDIISVSEHINLNISDSSTINDLINVSESITINIV